MEFNLFWDLLFVGGPFLTTTVSDSDDGIQTLMVWDQANMAGCSGQAWSPLDSHSGAAAVTLSCTLDGG